MSAADMLGKYMAKMGLGGAELMGKMAPEISDLGYKAGRKGSEILSAGGDKLKAMLEGLSPEELRNLGLGGAAAGAGGLGLGIGSMLGGGGDDQDGDEDSDVDRLKRYMQR